MKKTLLALTALSMVLVLSACSSSGSEQTTTTTESATTTETTTTTEAVVETTIDYPTENIRLIVPWAAGGGTDIAARIWAEALTEEMGVSVYVENMEGGSGVIGATEIYTGDADGYDVMFTQFGPIISQVLRGNTEYETEEMLCVASASAVPLTMVVAAGADINTIEELVDYASANPASFKYGTPGSGTAAHITCETFASAAGISMTAVTYDGTATAAAALLGGDVAAIVAPLNDVLSYLTNGQMELVYISKADESYPDAPLLSDAGYDVETATYTAFFVNDGTPAEIVAALEAAIMKTAENETLIENYANQGMTPLVVGTADMADAIASEKAATAIVLADLGLI